MVFAATLLAPANGSIACGLLGAEVASRAAVSALVARVGAGVLAASDGLSETAVGVSDGLNVSEGEGGSDLAASSLHRTLTSAGHMTRKLSSSALAVGAVSIKIKSAMQQPKPCRAAQSSGVSVFVFSRSASILVRI